MFQPCYLLSKSFSSSKLKTQQNYAIGEKSNLQRTHLLTLFLLALVTFIPSGILKSQPRTVDLTEQLPPKLKGEWYHPNTGSCTFGFYDQGAIFEGKFWRYDSIAKQSKSTKLYVTSEYGQSAALDLSVNDGKLHLTSSTEKNLQVITYFRFRELCRIEHNLPFVSHPNFSKDSVYLNYFLQNSANEQISVEEQQLIMQKGAIHFQSVDHNGILHMAIAVNRPILLEVHLPKLQRPEKVMMLPGSDITLLQTNGKTHYGGSGALLAMEMQSLFEKQAYGSDMNILTLVRKKYKSDKKPTPNIYKQQLLSVGQDLQSNLDSLYTARQISPLSYQIGKYNIRYAVADALLHYSEKSKLYWLAEPSDFVSGQAAGNTKKLPMAYFDFLKGLDDNGAIIAPAYRNFVESLRNPQQRADLPPLSTSGLAPVGQISAPILAKLLLPLKHLDEPLTQSQRILLKNVLQPQANDSALAFENTHQAEMTKLATDYYSIYVLKSTPKLLITQFEKDFDWKPGILTDLLGTGNMTQQLLAQGDTRIPADYFTGESSLFSNPFIAELLLEEIEKQRNITTTTTIVFNPEAGQKNAPASNYNNESEWMDIRPEQFISCDTFHRHNITLIFANNKVGFSRAIQDSMIQTFFKVYPKEMSAYNPNAAKEVIFVIDSACPLLAATVHNVVRFQPGWFDANPKDYDVVTHEVMHIVQDYQKNHFSPRWLTEGIADYVRQIYGLHNQEANWSMPPLNNGMHYTNSYRITARFLFWITEHKDKEFVQVVDKLLRDDTYTEAVWQQRTGKKLEDLWAEYTAAPKIDLGQLHLF